MRLAAASLVFVVALAAWTFGPSCDWSAASLEAVRVEPPSDSGALQRAIEASPDGRVVLPDSRTYDVRALLITRPGVTLACTGSPPATLKLPALARGDGAPILEIAADRFTLSGCLLDGNRAVQPDGGLSDSFAGRGFRAGIRADGAYSGLAVERATFRNLYGAAIATRNVRDLRVERSTFLDNAFEPVFADNAFPSGDPDHFLDGFTFVGNHVTRTGSGHGSVNANGLLVHQMRGLRIEDNVWDGYERAGMKLENCREGRIANNELRNGSLQSFGAITLQNGGHALVIEGNRISDAGSGIDSSLVVGGQYRPDGLGGITIRGNTIRTIRNGRLPDGIRLLGYGPAATDLVIEGNDIEGVPRNAINLRQFVNYAPAPTFSRITIRDNRVRSAGQCGAWFTGSAVQPTDVTDSGNTCE
ncbi:MAG: right-handed parallel beta-helix repeat-containing protein [Anaeromyxobacteraceae bacterium]